MKNGLKIGFIALILLWRFAVLWDSTIFEPRSETNSAPLAKSISFFKATNPLELKEIEEPFSTLLVNKTEIRPVVSSFTKKTLDFFNFVKYSFLTKFQSSLHYNFNLKYVFKTLKIKVLIYPFHFFT